ncbi:MAG: cell division protein ZapA [Bacteroidales bacterium]|nr:cell division protein ZapA [Bacteroidales bacterium]MBQ7709817.1 cell division protein ZapA [Bacteroidales bacterium]
MDQKISITIAGRVFNLTASTPDMEAIYRQAAEAINKRFDSYTRSHPGHTVNDILSMVALNETVVRLNFQRELEEQKKDQKQLEEDLRLYLEAQDKK